MAFTMRMSARRCPIGFGGMGHGAQNDDEEEPVEPPPAGNGVLVLTKHCDSASTRRSRTARRTTASR